MNFINKKKGYCMLISLFLLQCFIPLLVMAQDPGGGPDVPIDGGLSLLVAAGSVYGIRKYRKHKEGRQLN